MTTVALVFSLSVASAAQVIPDTPLITNQSTIPMSMLVVGRDHTLFYEAYNDASDIDGDGTLDIRFDPTITYYGLFDSGLCYTHSGGDTTSDKFSPSGTAGALGTCSDAWSGNWLNYVTTSRIDALRKVFYGGYRDVDTDSETVLRRAYIPQDAHSWAKEYTSESVDGYKISDYTPLSEPASGKRHFFGNLTATAGVNCAALSDCSDKPPVLRVVENSTRRVWAWASTERPVLQWNNDGGASRKDYTVRVQVCTPTYSDGCKRYPDNSLKPIGLLHEYGENQTMFFGLLTGSYNKNMSGGVLRKVVSSFKGEIDADTGQFTGDATIVNALNALRIRDFNNARTDNAYRGGWVTTRAMNEGEFIDWANPTGEMMYEALRYFAGKGSATPDFATSGSYDEQIGLPVAGWDDPYDTYNSSAKAEWCARPNLMVVSGINPSFDSDQVPGTASEFASSFSGDISGMDCQALAQTISSEESGIVGLRYIGQSGSNYDGAPTAKQVASLGNIRGLAPEEPTKQGSYYSASVAYFGKTNDLRPSLKGAQTVDTYAVVLSSPLPRIVATTTAGNTITLVPFAKSIGGLSISNSEGSFQPTNQIVDFYVDTIVNSSGPAGPDYDAAVNGGRYFARFRINFEDVEQGADHDKDAIVVYEISAEADGRLRVKLTPESQAGSIKHSMGYVISGTTKDGVYLVVQDENTDRYYHLNVPPGLDPGGCDVTNPPTACNKLPYIGGVGTMGYSERFFTGGSSPASLLKDPLWYAAKWGGFVDFNDSQKPDHPSEWDADGNGVPDTYFLVQNPLKLRDSLEKSLDTIVERSASAGNITSNGQKIDGDTRVFQSQFNSAVWEGELFAFPVTSGGVSETPSWKASEHLPQPSQREIFTWQDPADKGVEFIWTSLSSAKQATLGSSAILDYLRGEQSQEIQNAGNYRTRKKLLGDIVHSSPYYVKDTDTVYVGGNDGMLHVFAGSTGEEIFAYIPGLVFDELADLSLPTYGHQFYVDGDIAVSTQAQTSGQNILVASPGRGAKGLFALDVTEPGSFAATDVLWELDGSTDADFGFVLGRPQIGTLENGDNVVVVGNGYNSDSEKAVLYILNLQTGVELARIPVTAGGDDNGLSTPTLYDSDTNGKIDTVYAGDLKGNVWRFDVSGTLATDWKSHFSLGTDALPLFTATSPDSGPPQPITAQITVAVNDVASDVNVGKRFVFFGTGSYVFATDPADKQVQTWYGLIDANATISGRSALKERKIETLGTVDSFAVRVFSEATANDMSGMDGWYIDLVDPTTDPPTAHGERIVTRSNLYKLVEPALIASSIIPDPDPCEAGGSGYVNAINPFTGARLSFVTFDLNDDAKFDSDDELNSDNGPQVVTSFDPQVAMPGEPTLIGDLLVVGGSSGAIADMRVNLGGGTAQTGRISWREIQGD